MVSLFGGQDARVGTPPILRRLHITALAATAALVAAGLPGTATAAAPAGGELPLLFVENRGQVDDRADYYLTGKDTSVFFARDGLRMSLAGRGITDRPYSLGLRFVGARADARPVGRKRTGTEINHFRGARSDWKTGLSTYSELVYRDLWPGIDLVYSGAGKRLKYSFLVRPGADPSAIELAWEGAVGTKVARGGQLEVATPAGVLREDAPYSYQSAAGRRAEVESSYAPVGDDHYGFRVGAYDRSQPLVIDPATLVYAGFIGGSGGEQVNNADVDAAGNLYVIGTTGSPDFPATTGSFDQSFAGGLTDAFVAKVNPSGSGLVYASYIGGAGEEFGINIDVDAAGAAYVGGGTGSTHTTFPVDVGPDVTYNGGPLDAWVAKLTPDGSDLAYAGFVGGAAGSPAPGLPNEQVNGIAVDAAGTAYLSGFTGSSQATFPNGTGFASLPAPIPGFDQTFNSFQPGLLDGFVVKVRPNGSGLDYASYIGGGAADAATGLAIDGAGNAYVNLFAGSNERPPGMTNPFGGFPNGQGFAALAKPGFDQTFNGPDGPTPADVAVVKLNTAATGPGSLVYGTYIGGAEEEQPFGNVLDAAGNLHLTGRTLSDQLTFPNGTGFASAATPGFDQTFNGAQDAFVAKLNATGSALAYATYVGGAAEDGTVAIDLDSRGSAHVAGSTASTEASFPARGGPDSSYNGGDGDAFAAKLNPAGTGLDYAGYIGGSENETGIAMAVDAAGNAHLGGGTSSDQASGFPVKVGPDTTFNGPVGAPPAPFDTNDGFVAKIAETPAGGPPANPPVGAGPAPFTDCPSLTANVIRGSAASERIVGTPFGDRIFAGTGNDVVDGLAADDCIDLGPGGDRGEGGSGDDLVIGGLGADRMLGGAGGDRLRGGSSGDRLRGGSGNDRLHGQSGSDRVNGERGRDRINGGSSNDVISAGSSGDRVAGDQGNDRISGNSGNDSLLGNSGRDRISGGSGRDRLAGGSGNDRIGARDRRRDRVNCGAGRDSVVADLVDVVSRNCERVSRR